MINGNLIEIEKGTKYLETAKKVSDIINSLPISYEQSEKLAEAIYEHSSAGRLEAYEQGVREVLTTNLAEQLINEISQTPQLLPS